MTDSSWRDQLAGHRMRVDEKFAPRIRESALTNAEWSLVMTAVEFEIEGTGEDATLVADTSKVESVVPEFENVRDAGMMGGEPGGRSSGGFLDSVKNALGMDPGDEAAKLEEAVTLAEAYAKELQDHLQAEGRWESIRRAANQSSPE